VLAYATGDLIATVGATNPQVQWAGMMLLYWGVMLTPPSWWLLAVRFSQAQGHPLPFLTSTWTRLPFWIAGLFWLCLATNPWHGQFLIPNPGGRSEFLWLWWAHIAFAYTITLCVVASYARLAIRVRSSPSRLRALLMLFASILNLLVHMIGTGSEPVPFDPNILPLALTCVLFMGGVYGARLFAVSPVAVDAVLRHQPEGALLVDNEGLLLYANPAAETFLGRPLLIDAPVYPPLASVLRRADEPMSRLSRLLRMSCDSSSNRASNPRAGICIASCRP
jgi:PAS domain-containing protein